MLIVAAEGVDKNNRFEFINVDWPHCCNALEQVANLCDYV